jgi:hypothetical protein
MLPVPVPQLVQNDGAGVITVGWLSLAGLSGVATLADKNGTAVNSATSLPGVPVVDVPAPKAWSNPPYTITIAATDGSTVGDPSPVIPVLIATSVPMALDYDGAAVGVTLNQPPHSGIVQHIPTLYTDNYPVNLPPFPGILGSIPLFNTSETSSYELQFTDTRDIPVQLGHLCTTMSPPGRPTGLVTGPAAIVMARYDDASGNYDVDAQGPGSVGPAITGHRFRFSHGAQWEETDRPAGGGSIPARADGLAPSTVMAAGVANVAGVIVRGPYGDPYYLIEDAPTGVRLALTTASKLRVVWSAVPALPTPLVVLYRATLYCDDVAVESVDTTVPTDLTATFGTPLGNGVIPNAVVVAISSANSQGPTSPKARGPLRAYSASVVYDALGRLRCLPFDGWGTWSYTYDNLGNILMATVTPAATSGRATDGDGDRRK